MFYAGIPRLPTHYYNSNCWNVYNISRRVLVPDTTGNRNDMARDKGLTTAERKWKINELWREFSTTDYIYATTLDFDGWSAADVLEIRFSPSLPHLKCENCPTTAKYYYYYRPSQSSIRRSNFHYKLHPRPTMATITVQYYYLTYI